MRVQIWSCLANASHNMRNPLLLLHSALVWQRLSIPQQTLTIHPKPRIFLSLETAHISRASLRWLGSVGIYHLLDQCFVTLFATAFQNPWSFSRAQMTSVSLRYGIPFLSANDIKVLLSFIKQMITWILSAGSARHDGGNFLLPKTLCYHSSVSYFLMLSPRKVIQSPSVYQQKNLGCTRPLTFSYQMARDQPLVT